MLTLIFLIFFRILVGFFLILILILILIFLWPFEFFWLFDFWLFDFFGFLIFFVEGEGDRINLIYPYSFAEDGSM